MKNNQKTKSTAGLLLVALMGVAIPAWATDYDAILDWSDKRQLGTTLTGKVSSVSVAAGDIVKKGDLLLALDQRFYAVKKQQTSAAHKHAKLELEEAEREQERAIELYDRTVLSDYDRLKAERDLAKAESLYAQARADFQEAALQLEYSSIRSPYDGVVLRVSTAPGEVVVNQNESTVLIETARSDQMLAKAFVPVTSLAKLGVGKPVEVAFRGQWQKGTVFSIQNLAATAPAGQPVQYVVSAVFDVPPKSNARAGEKSAIRLSD